MRASGKFNQFSKFSKEPARISYSIYHIPQRELLIVKKLSFSFQRHAYYITPMFSTLLTICLYSANDVTSKWSYTSVILFLLHGFITLLHRALCDKIFFRILSQIQITTLKFIYLFIYLFIYSVSHKNQYDILL